MRNLMRLGLIAMTIVFCHSSAFGAQGPPPGSYRQSCFNIQMRNGTLFANCQDMNNGWRSTVLPDAYDCAGEITNINGELRCDRRNDWRYRDSLPHGSYRESCRNIRMRDDILSARCQAVDGRWVKSSLYDVDRCVGEVINDDGHLECGRRPWNASGSYVRTCAPIYVRGDDLRARCQTRDGRWVWTSLNGFDRCREPIANVDGQLRCGGGDRDDRDRDRDRDDRDRDRDRYGDRDRRPPGGTYLRSCQDVELRGDVLRARCQTADGRWNWTDLDDVFRCRGDISNDNGHLICSR